VALIIIEKLGDRLHPLAESMHEIPIYGVIIDFRSIATIDAMYVVMPQRRLVLAALSVVSPTNATHVSRAVLVLKELVEDFNRRRVMFCLTDLRPEIHKKLEMGEVIHELGPDRVFKSIRDAVTYLLKNRPESAIL
jgi:hypothetical protein